MKSPKLQNPVGLLVALMLPLAILAVLAFLGTRAQFRGVWSEAESEAERVVVSYGDRLGEHLRERVREASIYPNSPVGHGTESEGEIVSLPRGDLAALRQLRDRREGARSRTGLPTRVLAGLMAYEMSSEPDDASKLASLAVIEAPSIATPVVLNRIGWPASDSLWQRWREDETARERWRQVRDEGWVLTNGVLHWLAEEEGRLRYLREGIIQAILVEIEQSLAPGTGLCLIADGQVLAGKAINRRTLAISTVAFGEGLTLKIVAEDPHLIEAAARSQAWWTFSLLGVAFLSAGIAAFSLVRSLQKERRLGEMKNQFVASVSHELRSPVSSIRLMGESLQKGRLKSEQVAEFHGLIAAEGARLTHLIENVLDFARIEEGRKRYRPVEIELGELVRDALRLLEPQAAEREIRLTGHIDEVVVAVDPGAIFQALVNLIDNAIKFSPRQSEVEVNLRKRDAGACLIEVMDRGPGIPASERDKIFERFYRLGNELRRETQGSGIGLSIVRHIVEGHEGRVRVSERPGGGSVFAVVLPLAGRMNAVDGGEAES